MISGLLTQGSADIAGRCFHDRTDGPLGQIDSPQCVALDDRKDFACLMRSDCPFRTRSPTEQMAEPETPVTQRLDLSELKNFAAKDCEVHAFGKRTLVTAQQPLIFVDQVHVDAVDEINRIGTRGAQQCLRMA